MLALAVTQLLALMATKFSGAQQTRDAPNGQGGCSHRAFEHGGSTVFDNCFGGATQAKIPMI